MPPLWKPLVVCGIEEAPYNHMCGFADLIILAENIIADLVIVATMAVALVFMWAGLKLITAGMRGDSGAMKEAQQMFWNVVKGYVIILGAWIVVYTIINALLKPGYSLL